MRAAGATLQPTQQKLLSPRLFLGLDPVVEIRHAFCKTHTLSKAVEFSLRG